MPRRNRKRATLNRPWLIGGMLAVPLLLAAGLIGFRGVSGAWPWAADERPAPIGGPFTLVDGGGHTVTDQTFRGKWLMVFFGYTHCPDVCPTTLAEVAQALNDLGPLAGRIQPLFITVDPERDTPKEMHDFTAAFGDRIVGLTGNPEQIAEVATAYRVYYAKSGSGAGYGMDHSAVLYVMRPDGSFAGFMPPDTGAPLIAQKMKEIIGRG